MKYKTHLPIITLLVLCLAFLNSGCGSGNSSSNSGVTNNGVLLFQIDGNRWISGPPGHPELHFEEEAITDGSTTVRIEGLAADGSYLALTIYKESGVGPGIYPMTGQGMLGFYKPDFKGPIGYLSNGMPDSPGFITISEITPERVVGVFNFPVRNSSLADDIKLISGGSFEMQFSQN